MQRSEPSVPVRMRQRLAFAWCLSQRAGRDSPAGPLSPDLVACILRCLPVRLR